MVLLLVIGFAVVGSLGIFAFFYIQIRRNRRKQAPRLGAEDALRGICKKCHQHRIIIKQEDGLCALCWSSINTKQI